MGKYWRSIDETETGPVRDKNEQGSEPHNSEVNSLLDGIPLKTPASRRGFLKIMGYSVGSAALLAACKKPVQNAIPFLVQPTDVVPGKAFHYASTFFDGNEYCPIVVKVRDGRPVKLEGNNLYKYTRGGTSARVQASILSLYDNARIKTPLHKGKPIGWKDVDKQMIDRLEKIKTSGKEIVFLSPTIFSPSTLSAIHDFTSKYPNTKVVNNDVISYSALISVFRDASGITGIPYPLFDKAEVIVSFGADFLGTWLFPAEFALAYVSKRKIEKGSPKMSRHIQFEANLSLTGSNADERIQIKPSQELPILANLYNLLASKMGAEQMVVHPVDEDFKLQKIATELIASKGKSLVISGSNDENVQKIVIAINQLLDSFGNTFDMERPILLKQGQDKELFELVNKMDAGQTGAVFFCGSNPCYDYFDAPAFKKALEKVDLKVSLSPFADETSACCDFICPNHHFLESWNDYEPRKGVFSISQPCIHNLFDTRHIQESILVWAKISTKWADYIKSYWERFIYKGANGYDGFEPFWMETLRNGCLETPQNGKMTIQNLPNLKNIVSEINPATSLELQLVVPVGIACGFHSNNPWLQELPDPISRVTWDNYASVSPKFASENNLKDGDVIRIGNNVEIPVLVQPGQAYGVITAALNYGRIGAGKVAENVGVNMYRFVNKQNNNLRYFQTNVGFSKTSKTVIFAQTQTHHTMEGREIVRETTLAKYKTKPNSGNEIHEEFEKKHQTLYPERKYDSFHWGLGIDLNSCIGCGACTIACQAENNVAVVGKEQVTKRRIMHWIRVDRYYTGKPETPSVLFQPVMCQHCDNAPCENVCPVAATTHSNEGLNQMAYNRCIGTRYCINNCPYKVRRFNWLKFTDNPKFDYNQNSQLGKLVLNPDVVVRERGVVEKCTFCVQRIQEKKLTAKLENRALNDGEVVPACVQSCPAEAMTFGDLNDKHSNIFKVYANERNYHLLEELHTLPKVGYLTKVRNTEA